MPDGGAAPAGAVLLNRSDHSTRVLGLAERYENLIEHDVVEHPESGGDEGVGESFCEPAIPLDQIGESGAAQRAQRGPGIDAAWAA